MLIVSQLLERELLALEAVLLGRGRDELPAMSAENVQNHDHVIIKCHILQKAVR